MAKPDENQWAISIFVPEPEIDASASEDDVVENQSLRDYIPSLKRVVKVDGRQIKEQWNRTIDTLLELGGTIGSKAKGWEIDEIEVGMTLSAKGELLFIAEAGAEASVKFVLKKKPGVKDNSSATK